MTVSKKREFTRRIPSDKESKNLTILELIRKKGPISRTDISGLTNINIVSVSNYTNNFIKKELVLEGGFDISSGGRRPELLELNKKGNFVVGMEVRKDKLKSALTDLGLRVTSRRENNLKAIYPKNLQEEILISIEELIKGFSNKALIKAIGLGFTSTEDESKDEVYYDTELFLTIAQAVEERFGIGTFFGEDFVCAAFAEKNLNPQLDIDKILFLYSDLGIGVYIDGNDIYTQKESSEEGSDERQPAHYLKPWNLALGVASRAKHVMGKGMGTNMVEISDGNAAKVSIDTVIRAARDNDTLARDLIENTALTLGVRAAYLINLFSPSAVAVGGGIEKAGDLFLNPLKESIKKLAHKNLAQELKVLPGVTGEDQVMLGAASLAVREIFIGA